MTQYFYPMVTTGYRWNLLNRCLHELGVKPVMIGDMNDKTFLQFEEELSDEQKEVLDTVMNNDPQNPNPEWDFVDVIDLEAILDKFRNMCGVDVIPFYVKSDEAFENYDRIRLCVKGKLSDDQKQQIKNAYTKLFIG